MGRKRVVNGVRIDLWVDREDLDGLEERKKKTGVNVSEQIRLSIRAWLGKPLENVHPSLATIHKPSREVLDMLKYLSNKLPEGRHKAGEIELNKDPMMILFSKEWFKLKQMMEMTVAVLRAKMLPEVIFEEVIYPIEVPGTTRTRQHRVGFKIDFGKKIDRGQLDVLVKSLEAEIAVSGKIGVFKE